MFNRLKYTKIYELALPFFLYYDFLLWWLKKQKIYTPHLVKQRTVKKYADKYRSQVFIETGTYLGVMVNAMLPRFRHIYSIEIDKNLYKRAKEKFRDYSKVKIVNGDSKLVLERLLKKINKPSLFWLDAHYSKGITSKGNVESPILEELKVILNSRIKNYIILIDDAHLFNGKNDYPTLPQIKQLFSQKKVRVSIKNEHSIFIIENDR